MSLRRARKSLSFSALVAVVIALALGLSWALFLAQDQTEAVPDSTTMCVDSQIPGAVGAVNATIARLQPRIRAAHEKVAADFEAAGDEPWKPYVDIQPASQCPHGTPSLSLPTDGRLLRDIPVRQPVQSPSAYLLKMFVLPDADAQALFPGRDYLRMTYEQVCEANGGSCAEVSIALFIAESNVSNDGIVLDAIVDGLGFRQYLNFPTGHAPEDDGRRSR